MAGPFSFNRQWKRADKIKRFLARNPDMPELQRVMWERHLQNIALTPREYYMRYKMVYDGVKVLDIKYKDDIVEE